jgi:hypothetical protein
MPSLLFAWPVVDVKPHTSFGCNVFDIVREGILV